MALKFLKFVILSVLAFIIQPAAFAAGSLLLPYPTGADLSISEGKMGTKKAALTAASLAEQKEGKRKGRKQMKRGKCDYL